MNLIGFHQIPENLRDVFNEVSLEALHLRTLLCQWAQKPTYERAINDPVIEASFIEYKRKKGIFLRDLKNHGYELERFSLSDLCNYFA